VLLHRHSGQPRSGRPAIEHGLRDRVDVGVFEFGAGRNAARESRDPDLRIALLEQLADVVRGRVAFRRERGGDDHLADDAVDCTGDQPLHLDLARPDAVAPATSQHLACTERSHDSQNRAISAR